MTVTQCNGLIDAQTLVTKAGFEWLEFQREQNNFLALPTINKRK